MNSAVDKHFDVYKHAFMFDVIGNQTMKTSVCLVGLCVVGIQTKATVETW